MIEIYTISIRKMCWKIFYVCVLTVLLYPHICYGCPTMCSCFLYDFKCINQDLTEVPSGIPTSMKTINLSNNRITSLSEGVFTGFKYLMSINLGLNAIESLPEGLFLKNYRLTTVTLDNNRITSLPEGLFSSNSLLNFVSLGDNKIESLPGALFSKNLALKSLWSNLNKVHVGFELLRDNPLLCCRMTDLVDWIQDKTDWFVLSGTCTDPDTVDITLKSINTTACPKVDGQWSNWSESSCSSTCGTGSITRTRKCNNPEPINGQECQGVSTDVIDCYRDCPTDEEFDWVPLTIGLVVGTCVIIGIILVVTLGVLKSKATKVSTGI